MKLSARSLLMIVAFIALSYYTQPYQTKIFLQTFVSAIFLFCSSVVMALISIIKFLVLLIQIPIHYNNPPQYEHKVVVILGASSGIGKDLALTLAKKGATLVLCARRLNKLQEIAEQCRSIGSPEVYVMQVDVSISEQTQQLMDHVTTQYGKLDLLILNAAIPGPFAHVSDVLDIATLKKIMSINYWGYITPTIQSLPLLKKSRGDIIVVSSMYGKILAPYQAGYGAAKHAIHGFFDVLRQELSEYGIAIYIHCPGAINTEAVLNFQLGNGTEVVLHIPEFAAMTLADSPSCARNIIDSYESGEHVAYYPAYAGAFAYFRNIFTELFDFLLQRGADVIIEFEFAVLKIK